MLARVFPLLAVTPHTETSPSDKHYNCIAWAAGDQRKWWWPTRHAYWPPNAPLRVAIDAFVEAFASLGYAVCGDQALEAGYEKVAIFARSDMTPTHAARQLPDGQWTSKLGEHIDMSHELAALEGQVYGQVTVLLKRPV